MSEDANKNEVLELKNLLQGKIVDADLRSLIFDLEGVDYDELSGDTKTLKIQSLLTFLENRGRLDEVQNWIEAHRSDLVSLEDAKLSKQSDNHQLSVGKPDQNTTVENVSGDFIGRNKIEGDQYNANRDINFNEEHHHYNKEAKSATPPSLLDRFRSRPIIFWPFLIGGGIVSLLLFVFTAISAGADLEPAANTARQLGLLSTFTPTPTQIPTNTPTPLPTMKPSPTLLLADDNEIDEQKQNAPLLESEGIEHEKVSGKDRMIQVLVPAGDFIMGAEMISEPNAYLDSYWIDKYEVSTRQYSECVKSGFCEYSGPVLFPPSRPAEYVTWYEAQTYCEWVGRRLPSEAEWEKAARGALGALYPWGDSPPTCELANIYECANGVQDIGSYPEGASPYGALDMIGNVSEWTADWYSEDKEHKVIKGNRYGPGDWHMGGYDVVASYRFDSTTIVPSNGREALGFRCAEDLLND